MGVPRLEADALEDWSRPLREAGYEVVLLEIPDLPGAIVRRGGREVEIFLVGHADGSAAVFMSDKSYRFRNRKFVDEVLDVLCPKEGMSEARSQRSHRDSNDMTR